MTLLDTAGIRDTEDPVELEGVRRARARAADADLVLWVVDASEVEPGRPMADRASDGAGSVGVSTGIGLSETKVEKTDQVGAASDAGSGPTEVSSTGGKLSSPEAASWRVKNENDLGDPSPADLRPADVSSIAGSGSAPKAAGRWVENGKDPRDPTRADPSPAAASSLAGSGSAPKATAWRVENTKDFGDPLPSDLRPADVSSIARSGSAPKATAWRIRNKKDLLDQRFNRSEPNKLSIGKSEHKSQINTVLLNRVNESPIYRSEHIIQIMPPLTPLPYAQIGHKNELKNYSIEYEFTLSATSGDGFESLLGALTEFCAAQLNGAEQALVTRARHRRVLEDVRKALAQALRHAGQDGVREELLAEHLRIAVAALGRLTGRVDVEDILDVIFRDFCIGK